MTDGLLVLVHDVMAAMTTSPCLSVCCAPPMVKVAEAPTCSGAKPYLGQTKCIVITKCLVINKIYNDEKWLRRPLAWELNRT